MSTTSIVFENPGEIDPRLITLMGVNVKEAKSPIGFFGTGLKYGLATALRLGQRVRILSGLTTYEFRLRRETIRGKDFSQIEMVAKCNGNENVLPLGFTTELGRSWELWMSYREFLCNALDEGAASSQAGYETAHAVLPETGKTKVVVEGEQFLQTHRNRSEWYLTTKPLEILKCPDESTSIQIHPGSSRAIFYQGIRVAKLEVESLFTYNILSQLELSEDRQVKGSYGHKSAIVNCLALSCSNRALLADILLARSKTFERELPWSYVYSSRISEDFIAVVDNLFDKNFAILSGSAIELVKASLKRRDPRTVQLSKVQQMMLNKALAFLKRFGQEVTEEIVIVESLGSQWLHGLAKEGRIFLPLTTFNKGTKYLASTLLEEHLHCSLSLPDCSRELQDWLFDKVLSLQEEISGEPL